MEILKGIFKYLARKFEDLDRQWYKTLPSFQSLSLELCRLEDARTSLIETYLTGDKWDEPSGRIKDPNDEAYYEKEIDSIDKKLEALFAKKECIVEGNLIDKKKSVRVFNHRTGSTEIYFYFKVEIRSSDSRIPSKLTFDIGQARVPQKEIIFLHDIEIGQNIRLHGEFCGLTGLRNARVILPDQQ